MKFTKFKIKNYKGIKFLELDFSQAPKLNIFTLVGLNESGKTTILESINLFQKDIPALKRHTLIPKSKKWNFNDSVDIEATLDLIQEDEISIKHFAKTIGFEITQDIKQISITKKHTFKNSQFTDINGDRNGDRTLFTHN